MCAGCTFTIDQLTGRTTLTETDKYRDCLEEKAPTADTPIARHQDTDIVE